jgi:hypothetical protein
MHPGTALPETSKVVSPTEAPNGATLRGLGSSASPRGGVTFARLALAAGLGAGSTVLVLFLLRPAATRSSAAAPSPVEQSSAVTTVETSPQIVTSVEHIPPPSQVPKELSSLADDAEVPSLSHSAPVTRHPLPAPAMRTRPTPAPTNCDPPYFYDARGTRIFKKECL